MSRGPTICKSNRQEAIALFPTRPVCYRPANVRRGCRAGLSKGADMRRIMASLVACCLVGPWASVQAATPATMVWQAGQVVSYKIEHTTQATDSVGESKSETKSVMRAVRDWKCTAVDTAGVATLEMSLSSMYQERTTPGGETLVFDSANPEKSTPALKEVMQKFLNTTLAVLRVDATGKVVEVKSSTSHASSYENELPFIVLLPTAGLEVGQGWDRTFAITLAPPLGTGEKYDAVQSFVCKSIADGKATLSLTTALKTTPKAAADAIPLWQMMPEGEVVFDLKAGRLHSAKLGIAKELKGHQGEGSACKFTSTLVIEKN